MSEALSDSKAVISEYLQLILFFGILAFITHWAAWKKGFFTLHSSPKEASPLFYHVAGAFVIYLAVALVVSPIAAKTFLYFSSTPPTFTTINYLQLFVLGTTSLLLFIFCINQNRSMMKRIWKDPSSKSTLVQDFSMGVLTWLISFPLVVMVMQIGDLLLYVLFNVEVYEQVAVKYLKMTLQSPSMFAIALVSVLLFAPFVEELLFRGFLQSWFKRVVGPKSAILLSSFAFALFHLSSSQKLGNISLFVSLLVLGGYLGFIYERQKSLIASIGLHMTFNAVSTLRIISS